MVERHPKVGAVEGAQDIAGRRVNRPHGGRVEDWDVGRHHSRPRGWEIVGKGRDGVESNEWMTRDPVADDDGLVCEAIRERRRFALDETVSSDGRVHRRDATDGRVATVSTVADTQRAVEIGDVSVLLTAGDEARAEAIDGLLADLPAASTPPRIAVHYERAVPAMPDRAADYTAPDGDVWFDDTTVHVRLFAGGAARATSTSATIGGGEPRTFRMLFHSAVAHVLAFHDRFVLHAGAVAAAQDAYVVVGGTGAGKSTLGLAALEAGWHLLADDMVVVRMSGETTDVAGVPRPAAVPTDLGSALATSPLAGDVRARAVLPVATLRTGWLPVAGVISIGHAPSAAGTLEAVDGHATLRALLRSFVWTRNPLLLRRFFGTAAALSRLPGWDLRLGSHPGRRLMGAVDHLAAIVGA